MRPIPCSRLEDEAVATVVEEAYRFECSLARRRDP
jgi:hypothetical protein